MYVHVYSKALCIVFYGVYVYSMHMQEDPGYTYVCTYVCMYIRLYDVYVQYEHTCVCTIRPVYCMYSVFVCTYVCWPTL